MVAPLSVTWIKKDYHVHESHSSDAPGATVEKYCRMAERRGIDEIAFTTHLILTGPDVEHGVSPEKIQEYLDEIEVARGYTTVELRSGLEIDYFPEVEKRIETILEEHPLDFALGSLHYIRDIDIGSRRNSPRFFAGRPLEESLDIYFDGFKEAVESCLFDVIAHADYFRKYLHLTFKEPASWERFGTTVYEAVDSLRSYDVGISVNSSGLRHGLRDVYPIRGLLEAAYKAGVEKVTVGSDCHKIVDLGINTVKAVKRLEEAGYSYLCVFEKRRNRKVSLADMMDVEVP